MEGTGLVGLWGRPFLDLSELLDLSALDALHEELCLGLSQVPTDYTGGSHRSMGITPPSRPDDVVVDYGEVVRGLTDAQYATLAALADDEAAFAAVTDRKNIGEERDVLLSRRQMLWLKMRFGAYFPWKVYCELIPNRSWSDKSSAEGKTFTRVARTFFPQTIAFVERLPFKHVGRCNVMGLEAFDHGTIHRDIDPREQDAPDHFITLRTGGDKRLFLWDEELKREHDVLARAYWFNDADFHGVRAAPAFRCSLRIDGVFTDDFLATLTARFGGAA